MAERARDLARTVQQAEPDLHKAADLDAGDKPLEAAEQYVIGIGLLRTAVKEGKLCREDSTVKRSERLLTSASERFKVCEGRVQESRAADASSKSAPAAAKGGSGWLGGLWGGGKAAVEGLETREAEAAGQRRSASLTAHGSVPANAPPPNRSLPARPAARPPSETIGGSRPKPQPAAGRAMAKAGSVGGSVGGSRSGSVGGSGGGSGGKAKGLDVSSLKGVDKALALQILDEVVDESPGVAFSDIAGLEEAKEALQESIILPSLRPDLFTGLRAPPKGILLFGPPGTGKTLLAKAVATESSCRFFSLSASSLTSKWMGQGEKMVKALFAVASHLAPTVLFIDEVDSVLSARSSSEHEASRRLKTEFLVHFDGLASAAAERVIIVAATNRPQELDDAVRRRFTKRLFIPLPEPATRRQLVHHLFREERLSLSDADFQRVVKLTRGYSGSDLAAMCKEAAIAPIRELGAKIATVSKESVRGINVQDMLGAIQAVKPSVNPEMLKDLVQWNNEYGSYKVSGAVE